MANSISIDSQHRIAGMRIYTNDFRNTAQRTIIMHDPTPVREFSVWQPLNMIHATHM